MERNEVGPIPNSIYHHQSTLVVDTVDKNTPAEGGGRGDQDREYMLIHG